MTTRHLTFLATGFLLMSCRSDEELPTECITPAMSPRCVGGWCEVPAGCQRIGRPSEGVVCESRRSPLPKQRKLWITHAFEIQQMEMSVAQLRSLGLRERQPHTVYEHACLPDECPALLDWDTAAAAFNALSKKRGLAPCYDCQEQIDGSWICTHGSPGSFFACEGYRLSSLGEWRCYTCQRTSNGGWFCEHNLEMKNFFECRGYRLPSPGEWEHALFAGQASPLFAHANPRALCDMSLLDPIAWHEQNSNDTPHGRGLKAPNPLGIHDMFGNLGEWLDDHIHELVDPVEIRKAKVYPSERYLAYRRYLAQDKQDPLIYRPGAKHITHGGSFQTVSIGGFSASVPELDPAGAYEQPYTGRCVRTVGP